MSKVETGIHYWPNRVVPPDTETTRAVVERMYQAGIEATQNVHIEVAKVLDLPTIAMERIITDGDHAVGAFTCKTYSGAEVFNAEIWMGALSGPNAGPAHAPRHTGNVGPV